jgi:drug/metabolite transporter (DMT)-like permease
MAIVATLAWPSPVPAGALFYAFFTAGSALVCLPLALRRVGRDKLRAQLKTQGTNIALCAVITWSSYALVLEVLRSAPVSYVVAVRQISVLFAVAFAMFTLGERPGPARIAGAVASVLGVALIARG